jgi:hypothetical protein
MSSMGSSYTHRKAEGETTQWDDILRAKGITQPSQAELDKAAADAIAKAADEAVEHFDPLAGRTVEELGELEEGGGFDDSRVLESYRQARLAEMKAASARNRFGAVYPLVRVDFVREVNDASRDGTWVVIHLHQEHIEGSTLLARALARLAAAKKDVKCMVAKADACIEGYPDKNVPTLLLYRNGELQGQIVTLAELGGLDVSSKSALARRGGATPPALPCRRHSHSHNTPALLLCPQSWSGCCPRRACAARSLRTTPGRSALPAAPAPSCSGPGWAAAAAAAAADGASGRAAWRRTTTEGRR